MVGNPDDERKVDYYYQPWVGEGVGKRWRVGEHRLMLEKIKC